MREKIDEIMKEEPLGTMIDEGFFDQAKTIAWTWGEKECGGFMDRLLIGEGQKTLTWPVFHALTNLRELHRGLYEKNKVDLWEHRANR